MFKKEKIETTEFLINEEHFDKMGKIGDEIIDMAEKKGWDMGDFYFAIQCLLAMGLQDVSRQKRQEIYRQIERLSEMGRVEE